MLDQGCSSEDAFANSSRVAAVTNGESERAAEGKDQSEIFFTLFFLVKIVSLHLVQLLSRALLLMLHTASY